jgi:hypothetical protein
MRDQLGVIPKETFGQLSPESWKLVPAIRWHSGGHSSGPTGK